MVGEYLDFAVVNVIGGIGIIGILLLGCVGVRPVDAHIVSAVPFFTVFMLGLCHFAVTGATLQCLINIVVFKELHILLRCQDVLYLGKIIAAVLDHFLPVFSPFGLLFSLGLSFVFFLCFIFAAVFLWSNGLEFGFLLFRQVQTFEWIWADSFVCFACFGTFGLGVVACLSVCG